jgi:DNA-binding MarR family transcriptional regulator
MSRDPRSTDQLGELIGDDAIGHEGRAVPTDHAAVKTWLRLLACTTQIETEIRRRLRLHFDMTLPRFDYLAQLHRFHDEQPQGLRMNQLSRFLMVTGGNVTSLTDELEKSGHVTRNVDPDDRRSFRIALTARGRRAFEKVAAEHERWVVELLGDLNAEEGRQLHALLGHLRLGLTRRLQGDR